MSGKVFTIDWYVFIPSLAASVLAAVWFGWKGLVIVLLLTVKGGK